MTRRGFLKTTGVVAAASLEGLTGAAPSQRAMAEQPGSAEQTLPGISRPPGVPDHLPPRLAISCWQWAWMYSAAEGEPFDDLEAVVRGLKERGFNTIRIDAGLDLCFRADGSPRGEVAFRVIHPPFNTHFRCVYSRNGFRCDVLPRLRKLMWLAKEHRVFVILSSWEYMHTTGMLAERALRDEILDVPKKARLARLAEHHDRLLSILKNDGTAQAIAFVEPHNEVHFSELVQGAEGKQLHAEAIRFLRQRHPDVLISGDFGKHLPDQIPDNVQVYDQHVYGGVRLYWENLYERTIQHPDFDPADPLAMPLLRELLQPGFSDPQEFLDWGDGCDMGAGWALRNWLNANLDLFKFDRFMLESYARDEQLIKATTTDRYQAIADGATRRSLPVVIDEGGFFCAPLRSRFEETETARSFLDFLTDLAIHHKFWGFVQTTYNGPDNPLWWSNPGWLRENNHRFLSGVMTRQYLR